MGLLTFSNTKQGRLFALSLTIFTVFTLTNVLKGLPVMGGQLPIIVLCYVLLLLSCKQMASNRIMGLTLFLLVFDYIFVFLQGGGSDATIQNRIGANYTIFVCFFPLLYAVSGNFVLIDKRKYLKFVYILAFVTSITTIYGTYLFNTPCRELATPDNPEIDRMYKSMNIGGYGFVYFLVLLTPIIMRELFNKITIYKLAMLATMAFCIFRAEYTTALLMFIMAIALSFIVNSKSRILRIIMIIAVLVFAVSFDNILNWASSSVFDYSYTMGKRLEMVSDYNNYGEATDDMGIRQVLYLISIEAFLNNPLFGNLFSYKSSLGGHSEILDYLGHSGIVGLFVLIALITYIRKHTPVSRINLRDPFIKALLIIVLILASINTFLASELYYGMLIVPMLIDDESKVGLA